jgi:hypothetical protein
MIAQKILINVNSTLTSVLLYYKNTMYTTTITTSRITSHKLNTHKTNDNI